MFNHELLMSDACHFSVGAAINPYYSDDETGGVNLPRAVHEHEALAETMTRAGITVTRTESPADSQDGVYTANWALVRGETAVLARLPDTRDAEHEVARRVLQDLGKNVVELPVGLKFSGQGDALPCGNLLFCGQTYRSDAEAQRVAAHTLGFERVQLQAVPQHNDDGSPVINRITGWPDSYYYDIDLALSIIRPETEHSPGLIAWYPDAFTPASRQVLDELESAGRVERIDVTTAEATGAFACNLVSTGYTVVMSQLAPRLRADLEAYGLEVFTPEITELGKGGGYIRCTTLTLT